MIVCWFDIWVLKWNQPSSTGWFSPTIASCSNKDIEKALRRDGRYFSQLRFYKASTILGEKSGSGEYLQDSGRMIDLRL